MKEKKNQYSELYEAAKKTNPEFNKMSDASYQKMIYKDRRDVKKFVQENGLDVI